MGNQEIFLAVISIVIIGIAIAVGLTMFTQNTVEHNRKSCIADMNHFAALAIGWWKTPLISGGGNRVSNLNSSYGATNYIDVLGNFIGNNYNETSNKLSNGNGSYEIQSGGANSVKFIGMGTVIINDAPVQVTLTVDLYSAAISIDIIN